MYKVKNLIMNKCTFIKLGNDRCWRFRHLGVEKIKIFSTDL